jgi:heme-degrading monooxygenase HmoA
MILEVASLNIRPEGLVASEAAFPAAARILSSRDGYTPHQPQRSVDTQNRYVLLVNWQTKENHTVDFCGWPQYQEGRKLLHHFFDPHSCD